jgi:hypothetical protein
MKIKNTLIALIGACLMSCSTTPTNTENWMETKRNACLPTAIAFREGLRKYDVWSEVVIYKWFDLKSQTTKRTCNCCLYVSKGTEPALDI